MTATATKSAGTVRVVIDEDRFGHMARFSNVTGALLGSMSYSEWDGYYTVTHVRLGKQIRTQDYDRAHHFFALTN